MVTENPVLFVGGCPRSGTTLLQRMLDHHPQLAMANDSHFIPRALERLEHDRDPSLRLARTGGPIPLSAELKESVWQYHRFYRLGIVRSEYDQIAEQATTYQQLVTGLFDAFAEHAGKRFAGEKTPDYIKHVPLLLGMFPRAGFVNIVRDGRDVALSLSEWATANKGPGRFAFWKVDPIAIAALWWSEFVRCGARYAEQFPNRLATIHYEQLVEQPSLLLGSICTLSGVDYDERMLDYHVGKQQKKPNLSAKKQWLPPTRGLRNWRDMMPHEDVEVFHRLAGASLRQLGYEFEDEPPSRAAVQRSSEAVAWWQANQRAPIST